MSEIETLLRVKFTTSVLFMKSSRRRDIKKPHKVNIEAHILSTKVMIFIKTRTFMYL